MKNLMARRFNNTMRYIDDLLILNNFNYAIQDIYPSELQLKKTTECPTTLSYLDILITIEHGLRCVIRGIVFGLTSSIFQI